MTTPGINNYITGHGHTAGHWARDSIMDREEYLTALRAEAESMPPISLAYVLPELPYNLRNDKSVYLAAMGILNDIARAHLDGSNLIPVVQQLLSKKYLTK